MKKKMVQFDDLKQETPLKRNTAKRKDDFNEIVPAIPKIIKNKIKIFTGIL